LILIESNSKVTEQSNGYIQNVAASIEGQKASMKGQKY